MEIGENEREIGKILVEDLALSLDQNIEFGQYFDSHTHEYCG
jgi:hypothetical protein